MERFRDLTGDPAAMKALAHPVRLSVLELLGRDGPLTATEAGRRLNELPGTMSWHLRLLGRHGFVTEADGGRGRRRPWRLTSLGTRWDTDPRSGPERDAVDTLLRVVLDRAVGQLRGWLASRYAAPLAWRRAAALSDWTMYVTAAETEQLRADVHRLLDRYGDRIAQPENRPAGAIAVRALFAMHPQQLPDPTDP